MKTLLLSLILCLSSWACSLAQTSAKTAPLPVTYAVNSLTQPAPVVIATPFALTATDPATLAEFVKTAIALRVSAESRIRALEGSLAAVNAVIEAGSQLTRHDQETVEQQSAELTVLRGQLEEINRVLFRCWALLPARYQRLAAKGVPLYDAVEQYQADLKRRGNRLLLIGTALGGLIVLFLPR